MCQFLTECWNGFGAGTASRILAPEGAIEGSGLNMLPNASWQRSWGKVSKL